MNADCHTPAPISLLIAATVRLYREGLASALKAQQHLRVDGTAATWVETRAAVRDLQPDVVILDVAIDDIIGLMRALRAESSRTRILAFAVREEITTILGYAEAGADGFVTSNSSVAELVQAIERTAAGELLCSPRIAAQLLRRAAQRPSRGTDGVDPILTNREQQVFMLLKEGRSNKEIGTALNIAEATVKNHVHHLLEKLQVGTRGQAVATGILPAKAGLASKPSSRRAG